MAFDRKEYQRQYMRVRRANDKSNGASKSNAAKQSNVVEMKPRRRPMLGVDDILALARAAGRKPPPRPFTLPEPPPGVVPKGKKPSMAMDDSIDGQMQFLNQHVTGVFDGMAREGMLFLGYAYLSQLAQRAEYRIPTETIATEMTRKWIKFRAVKQKDSEEKAEEAKDPAVGEPGSERPEDNVEPAALARAQLSGDYAAPGEQEQSETETEDPADEKADKIKELEDEFERLQVRDLFKTTAMHDGFFGRAHIFVDLGTEGKGNRDELVTDIGDGLNDASLGKVAPGSLKALRAIEPVWTYPTYYNATNPLRDDWYNPTVWYVMGVQIHCSRLLTFVGRPVPDLLKPSYMFGGLSLSQLVQPYVQLWLDTRQNIGNLIQAFSVMVLSTDLSAQMQPGTGESMFERAAMFNAGRDNAGLMMINKNTEEFKNVAAPLGGLHELQAQSQEHMAAVVRIPLVKFTGISPAGLNASSEGEIRVFYDTIHAYQEALFRPNLTKVMHFAMLSLWGVVDPDITFDFEPLWALSEKEEAEVRKLDAETDDILINGCAALHPEETRKRIAADPDSPYSDIDVEDVPEPPDPAEAMGGKINLKGTTPFGGGAEGGGGGGGGGGASEGGGGDE